MAEPQGHFLGQNHVIWGGFSKKWSTATNRTFSYNVTSATSVWLEKNQYPIPTGITHAAVARKGASALYSCGGYVGGTSDGLPATQKCFAYTNALQWVEIPPLPAIRAGGGLWYDSKRNSLIYSGGASIHILSTQSTNADQKTTWELKLGDPAAIWQLKADTLYTGNHQGFTTVTYQGKERHFLVGGQNAGKEYDGNKDNLVEYDADNDKWDSRQNMLFPRGHFSSSVIPYRNCGFLIAGGATNSGMTSDISYYEISTNKWHKIGNLTKPMNTPACGIFADYLHCQGGSLGDIESWKRRINTITRPPPSPTAPVPVPVPAPVPVPVAVPAPVAPASSLLTGSFSLVKTGQNPDATLASIFLGSYRSGAIIVLDTFKPNSVSLFVETRVSNFSKIVFQYNGLTRTEGSALYALGGNFGSNYTYVKYLATAGNKTFTAQAYYGKTIIETKTYTFTLK